MTTKEARLAAGLTQQEMSDRLLIPIRTLQAWEYGTRECPEWARRLVVAELMRIAEEQSAISDTKD